MAEPLKNSFGPEVTQGIAAALASVASGFDGAAFDEVAFVRQCLDGYEELELTPRARQIAAAMADHLPSDRAEAMRMVIASLGPELPNVDPDDVPKEADANPMAGFFYMPHGYFVADDGNDDPDVALEANYEITKRFTSEFSIRSLIDAHPELTMQTLHRWATDENVHVRRLVSEGTRPRLPWAGRLRRFQDDPEPVIALLELLRDDPVEYVRRSVANNLNDIAKDHPERVIEIARAWWPPTVRNDGDHNRRRLIRHALRTLIKAAHPDALDVLGFGDASPAEVASSSIEPANPTIGDKVVVELELVNPTANEAGALVDLRVHFVKADGSTSPKVFKGGEFTIEPTGTATMRKSISVRQHSTRTHYPGTHKVEAIVNGTTVPLKTFELLAD